MMGRDLPLARLPSIARYAAVAFLLSALPAHGADDKPAASDNAAPKAGRPGQADGKPPAPGSGTGIDPRRFGAAPPDPAYGAYQRGLYLTALKLAMPRAEKGDAAAQTLVAEIYSHGLGVPRDDKKAAEWYEKAAEQGVTAAEFQYALYLLDGKVVPKDEEKAFSLMKDAAAADNRMAAFNYAQMLMQRDSSPDGMKKAFVWYEKAADAGLADAQYAMSQAYANGVGGKPKDDVEARRWMLLAARQNYDTAQLDLGTWLVEGRGGPADLKEGFGWLKRAAEGGNVAAENRLAKLYRDGIGVKADKVEAGAWYVLARRAGLSDPGMDIFFGNLSADEQKQAIERANRLR